MCLMGLTLFLVSCAKRPAHPPWFFKVAGSESPVGSEEIFRLPEGDRISFSQLIGDLHSYRVIFVGESHDQIEHHRIEAKLLETLLKEKQEIVVAMEMFQRSQQPTLDRWSQGVLTEEEFLREVDWEKTWGTEYTLYKGILDTAREHRVRILGLNIPKELTRKVARKGIGNLSAEDRLQLPEMDLTDRHHRKYIRSLYKGHHGGTAKDFEHFYQAQCLWDEAMAETLADFLKSPQGAGKTALVFSGIGHVVFDFGIPKRLYRRVPLPYQVIVLKEWKKGLDEDLLFYDAPEPLTDFLWITKPGSPHSRRPRIGMILNENQESKEIWIERVLPDSPAEKAGLLPGDQLVAIDGKEVKTLREIHDAVAPRGWGKEIIVIILRNGEKKEVTVNLPPVKGQ